MKALHDTQSIFFMEANRQQSGHIVNGKMLSWPGYLMSDHAARYIKSGIMTVLVLDGTAIKIYADETFLDQNIISCLLIAANLTGKVSKTTEVIFRTSDTSLILKNCKKASRQSAGTSPSTTTSSIIRCNMER
jgi:hypothetical protein